jgi:hypothetical protein
MLRASNSYQPCCAPAWLASAPSATGLGASKHGQGAKQAGPSQRLHAPSKAHQKRPRVDRASLVCLKMLLKRVDVCLHEKLKICIKPALLCDSCGHREADIADEPRAADDGRVLRSPSSQWRLNFNDMDEFCFTQIKGAKSSRRRTRPAYWCWWP